MTRLVVTGKSGQLTRALQDRAMTHDVEVIAVGRPELDLADAKLDAQLFLTARPDVIVSAAAYTAVDQAEIDQETAEAINGRAPGLLAKIAQACQIPIIHLSTDYVFDGAKSNAYEETDPTHPLGTYGSTKLRGEDAVRAATDRHVILRTAWVYSPFGSNFVKTMLRLGTSRAELNIVGDQIGCPTSAIDLADAIITIAQRLHRRADDSALFGTFHLVGGGQASWADFAAAIFDVSAQLGGPTASVKKIGTDAYPTAARRPANSRLETGKVERIYGITMPDWKISMRQTVTRLLAERS